MSHKIVRPARKNVVVVRRRGSERRVEECSGRPPSVIWCGRNCNDDYADC